MVKKGRMGDGLSFRAFVSALVFCASLQVLCFAACLFLICFVFLFSGPMVFGLCFVSLFCGDIIQWCYLLKICHIYYKLYLSICLAHYIKWHITISHICLTHSSNLG